MKFMPEGAVTFGKTEKVQKHNEKDSNTKKIANETI